MFVNFLAATRGSLLFCMLMLALPSWADSLVAPRWLADIVREHPDTQAALARLDASKQRVAGASRMVYDPSLELGGDRSDGTDYDVGISQQLDLSGRRRARRKTAAAQEEAALAELAITVNRVAQEVMTARANALISQEKLGLSQQRVELVSRLTDLMQRRQSTGDASQADADLALFSLGSARNAYGEAAIAADATREALERAVLRPNTLIGSLADTPSGLMLSETPLEELPEFRLTQAQVALADGQIQIARSDTRIDPTLSLSGGREEDESRVGLGISIPLPFFGGSRRELAASISDRSAMDHELARLKRDLELRIAASKRRVAIAEKSYQGWQSAVGNRLEPSGELLERLFKSGELDVSSYLFHLEQRIAAEESGLDARARWWSAWNDQAATQAAWSSLLMKKITGHNQ